MKIGSKRVVIGALLAAVALVAVLFAASVPRDSSEAAAVTPGGIFAAPSALPGLPAVVDQILPAISPAHGDGSLVVVGYACDPLFGLCPDVEGGEVDGITYVNFAIERAWPDGSAGASFAANGMDTLKCDDQATCDVSNTEGIVAVMVTGGGVNEVVNITATDESGDSRLVKAIFVETIFAVSPLNSGTAMTATLVSYNCPDIGAVPAPIEDDGAGGGGPDWEMWLEDTYLYDQIAISFDPMAGVLFYKCGGDSGSPVDDRVNFETDLAILTVEEFADIDEGLVNAVGKDDAVTNECDVGDSVDVLDNPNTNENDDSQECDLDGAPNGVVTYGLLGTSDVGVATVTAQQSGGGGVNRTINVTFAGEAALQLFIDAPAAVGTSGADFSTVIVDQDGRPIPGETIECSVSPTGGALIIVPQTGTSDANGEVTFTMVPTGASVVAGEELTINCHLDSNPDVKASATVNLSGTPDLESVALVEGCNPVASTWPDATAAADAGDAVAPAEALDAIWKFDAASGAWQGYSPSAPAAVSDLESIDFLDAVFICVNAAATWSRPVI